MSRIEIIQCASVYMGMVWLMANILLWECVFRNDWWWYMRDRTLTVAFFVEIVLIVGIPVLIYLINQ